MNQLPNDTVKRNDLYKHTKDDLMTRQIKNSESYDRAILSLSSGALAISLSFIRDIVPCSSSHDHPLLIVSWALFGASILFTILSYPISQHAITLQLIYARKYYIEKQEEYLHKINCWRSVIPVLGYTSGLTFIAAFICTITFVSINL